MDQLYYCRYIQASINASIDPLQNRGQFKDQIPPVMLLLQQKYYETCNANGPGNISSCQVLDFF